VKEEACPFLFDAARRCLHFRCAVRFFLDTSRSHLSPRCVVVLSFVVPFILFSMQVLPPCCVFFFPFQCSEESNPLRCVVVCSRMYFLQSNLFSFGTLIFFSSP